MGGEGHLQLISGEIGGVEGEALGIHLKFHLSGGIVLGDGKTLGSVGIHGVNRLKIHAGLGVFQGNGDDVVIQVVLAHGGRGVVQNINVGESGRGHAVEVLYKHLQNAVGRDGHGVGVAVGLLRLNGLSVLGDGQLLCREKGVDGDRGGGGNVVLRVADGDLHLGLGREQVKDNAVYHDKRQDVKEKDGPQIAGLGLFFPACSVLFHVMPPDDFISAAFGGSWVCRPPGGPGKIPGVPAPRQSDSDL